MARRLSRIGIVIAAVALTALGLAALCAPYIYAEYGPIPHDALIGPRPSQPIRGRWFDDYFVVEAIDPTTYAIGEPRYYQGNYSYLILGSERAVLLDAGSGSRDIVPVIRSLTALPVTVVPSHLHFDHVGALGRFDRTALLDVSDLRARTHGGMLALGRYEFLGFADRLPRPRFRVDEWWQAGTAVDLGGRHLVVMSTPGHTPSSLSLYDADRHQLFCGDFLYPGQLFAFLPGSSRQAYLLSSAQLLAAIAPGTELLTAHLPDDPVTISAPRLGVDDLRALRTTLEAIDAGTATATGIYPRVFPVNAAVQFATGFPWNTR